MTSPISKGDIKPGARFMTRTYPNLGEPDMNKTKVVAVYQLGDGSITVKHRHFLITQSDTIETFIKNSAYLVGKE